MKVTTEIPVDLARKGILPVVQAVQNDKNTRYLSLVLTANNQAWTPPDGTMAVVRYRKSDGRGGEYDLLPDGSAACSIDGNVVSVVLAPQVLTTAGPVRLNVGLIEGEQEISTFQLHLNVERNVYAELVDSEDYYNTSWVNEAITQLQEQIDDLRENGTGALAQADFAQNDPTAADYVKGRTHWTDDPVTKVLLPETLLSGGEYTGAGLIGLEEGVTYDVTYNGQLYKCKGVKVLDQPDPRTGALLNGYAIGNVAAFAGAGSTGEPFVIGDVHTTNPGDGLYCWNSVVVIQLDGGTGATISVEVTTQETHKLDAAYLPEPTHGPMAVQVPLDLTAEDYRVGTLVKGDTAEEFYPVFFAKVSDLVLSADELKQCVLEYDNDGKVVTTDLSGEEIDDDGSSLYWGPWVRVVYDAPNSEYFADSGNGIYFQCLNVVGFRTSRLYSDTVTMPGVEYKKLPAEYLPGLVAVAITQADYDALVAAGTVAPGTLYVITG